MSEAHTPRGLVGWLPWLWSRVLFTAPLPRADRLRTASLLLLIVLPAILLYPSRSYHLLEPDEGRYAQIAREMLERGDWVVPVLQSEPYLDKPPLFYWLIMLSYSLFGVSDSVARIVPTMAVHFTILMVYLLGRRSLGERSAFWGALLLALMPGFIGMGRLLILDGLLTSLVMLSLLLAFEAIRGERLRKLWWCLTAIVCGFGVLTKGPIALLLLVPPIVMYLFLMQSSVRIGWRGWLSFGVIVFAVNFPWYLAIYLREPVFLRYFFWEHNVLRFLSPFDHLEPVWFYVPIVLGGLLPGTFLLWSLAKYLNREGEQRPPSVGYWMLAGGWCVFFFSLSGSKLPTYVLPAFPCFALVFGHLIVNTHWQRSTLLRAGLATNAVLLIGFVYVALPWYAKERSPMGRPELVREYLDEPGSFVVCYPRHVDSVAFYLERNDLNNVRSKETAQLVQSLLTRPRTVILFTHDHSLEALKQALPPALQVSESISLRRSYPGFPLLEKLAGKTPWGLCDIGVIEIKELARVKGTAKR